MVGSKQHHVCERTGLLYVSIHPYYIVVPGEEAAGERASLRYVHMHALLRHVANNLIGLGPGLLISNLVIKIKTPKYTTLGA